MSIPNFLIEKLAIQYGEELTKKILEGYSKKRKVTLRVNTIKSNIDEIKNVLNQNNIEYRNVTWSKEALIIEQAREQEIKKLKIYEEGKIYLQSLSSMLPPIILEPKENEDILDMAAAPGGKTTQMAAMLNNNARITACEMNIVRTEKLKYNIEKQGASSVYVMVTDSRKFDDLFAFDRILLDAPCSGSGTDNVFKSKVPYITYFLIAVNIIFYVVPMLLGIDVYNNIIEMYCIHGPSIRAGQYYRLLTGIFLHGSIIHLLCNCYSLYILGSQIESLLGKFKYLVIYFFSGLTGALLSTILGGDAGSIGASGAIFGLMGALVYFGYYYRVYLGNAVKSQIIPLILLNLFVGFMSPGIDNFAHIGGLVGGAIVTMALGVKDKSSTFEKINGWIICAIFLGFLMYMGLVVAGR